MGRKDIQKKMVGILKIIYEIIVILFGAVSLIIMAVLLPFAFLFMMMLECAIWSVESIIRMRSDRKMLGGSWRDDE